MEKEKKNIKYDASEVTFLLARNNDQMTIAARLLLLNEPPALE